MVMGDVVIGDVGPLGGTNKNKQNEQKQATRYKL